MQITYFRIENYRSIRLAECVEPPDFMVICGGNGCGKSAVLNALMAAKERAGAYGNFVFDSAAVSADAKSSTITMRLKFSDVERDFVRREFRNECPESDEIIVEIKKGGEAQTKKRSAIVSKLLSSYTGSQEDSPGFFEYIDAHRPFPKTQLTIWDSTSLLDKHAKGTLAAESSHKFQFTKAYLAGMVFQDLQHLQKANELGRLEDTDSLKEIRDFFDTFFAPMKFLGVTIHTAPFQYRIGTPRGGH